MLQSSQGVCDSVEVTKLLLHDCGTTLKILEKKFDLGNGLFTNLRSLTKKIFEFKQP